MKYNVSKQTQKKSYFPGTVPCSTTLNFFQPVPVFSHEVVPGSTFHISMRQFCRTSVLNLPTWGDYKILTKSVFVPYGDVFKAWDSFLSGTKYFGQTAFVPTAVPSVLNEYLLDSLVNCMGWNSESSLSNIVFYDENGELLNPTPTELSVLATAVTEQFNIGVNWSNNQDVTVANSSWKRYTRDIYLGTLVAGGSVSRFANSSVYIAFSEQAKMLHKILVGLGYNLGSQSVHCSALPLMCYCKAVYDLFSPNRTDSTQDPYESTALYGIVYRCMGSDAVTLTEAEVQSLFQMLLSNTYYVNNDFQSLFRKNVAVTQSETLNLPYMPNNGTGANMDLSVSSSLSEDQTSFSTMPVVTSDRLKAIFRIGSLVKANTLIGGKLREFIRSRFGSSLSDPHELFEISSTLMDLNISDIFSTASTDQSVLGEYGGRALGDSKGTIKFSSDKFGMFFVISVALQNRYYADTVNPACLRSSKNDFYNPSFDSLGYEIAPYSYFKSYFDQLTSTGASSFAYIPRYSSYKFFKPVVSGDFSRYGIKESILGFVGNSYKDIQKELPMVYTMEVNKPAFYPSLYNTNHIFYESEQVNVRVLSGTIYSPDAIYGAIADPLILHTYLKIDMHAPMIGRSDVFETNDGDNPSITVES